MADVAQQQLDVPRESRRGPLVLGFAQKPLRAIGEEGPRVDAAFERPLQPLDLFREITFCFLLRDSSKAREDALAPALFVDRAPSE